MAVRGEIFISYRRDDSSPYAGRLRDALHRRFPNQVFLDRDIPPGAHFEVRIEESLHRCEVLLVVIGKRWLQTRRGGVPRLQNPNDLVRREIAIALRRGITVVPVLVEGASIPEPKQLPDDIRALSTRQAHELSDTRWDYDVGELIKAVQSSRGKRLLRRVQQRPLLIVPLFALLGAFGYIALAVAFGGSDSADRTSEFPPPTSGPAFEDSPPVRRPSCPPEDESNLDRDFSNSFQVQAIYLRPPPNAVGKYPLARTASLDVQFGVRFGEALRRSFVLRPNTANSAQVFTGRTGDLVGTTTGQRRGVLRYRARVRVPPCMPQGNYLVRWDVFDRRTGRFGNGAQPSVTLVVPP